MSYTRGHVVEASHVNDHISSANALWGTGSGDRGYGQGTLSVPSAGQPIGQAYSSIRSVMANLCSWQNTATTKLPTSGSVASDAAVVAFPASETPSIPDLFALLDSSRLNYQIGNMTLTASAANTTRSAPWGFSGPDLAAQGYAGTMTISGANGAITAYKDGADSVWSAGFGSTETLPTCHLQFRASQNNEPLMVGLTRNSDGVYSTIEFAWYPSWGGGHGVPGNCHIYESGGYIGDYGAYTTSTVFAITYDGTNVRYYKDGSLVRTVTAAGRFLRASSSFYSSHSSYPCAINSLEFGPGTTLGVQPYFIQGGFNVDFGSDDAARYFFNTGGQVRMYLGHSNTSTPQDTNWNSTLSNFCLSFSAHNTTKLSGNGTVVDTSFGYYDLTTDWVLLCTIYGSGAYSGNVVQIWARWYGGGSTNGAHGSLLQFYANFYENHEGNYYDMVSAGTSFTIGHLRATGSPLTSPISAPSCTLAQAL